MTKTYEIRDAIYGFIELNEWEREIINHPVFQRLRRIRQLSLTDMGSGLKAISQSRLYVPKERKKEAEEIVSKINKIEESQP